MHALVILKLKMKAVLIRKRVHTDQIRLVGYFFYIKLQWIRI